MPEIKYLSGDAIGYRGQLEPQLIDTELLPMPEIKYLSRDAIGYRGQLEPQLIGTELLSMSEINPNPRYFIAITKATACG
jgi:hypothetical protein